MITIFIDFHTIAEDNAVWASLRYASAFEPEEFSVGTKLTVIDPEGLAADGEVIEMDGDLVKLRLISEIRRLPAGGSDAPKEQP